MIKQIGLAAMLSASLIAGGACAQKKYVDQTHVVDFESIILDLHKYVSENYPRLISELKGEYPFEFLQKVPLPEVDYYLIGDAGQENAYGYYNPDEKKISLSIFHNTYLSEKQVFKIGQDDGGTSFLDETLKHEFIHYYTHLLSENIGIGRFPIDRADMPGKEALIYLDKLKSEGISETLVPSSKRKYDFSDDKWQLISKTTLLEFSINRSEVYPAALHFTKPIIDAYGEAGIVAIIKEETKPDDIKDIPGLRRRIIERLKAQ